MAHPVYASLDSRHTGIIKAEISSREFGGLDISDMIECFSFSQGIGSTDDNDPRSALRTRPQFEPLTFTTRLDGSTPQLIEAMMTGTDIHGKFFHFRSNTNTGEVEHFFTIEISRSRVIAVDVISPDTRNTETVNLPALVEVTLYYSQITWISETASTEYEARFDTRTASRTVVRPH